MGASASILQQELKSPIDGSDLSERQASIEEVKKLRAMAMNYCKEEAERIAHNVEMARRTKNGSVRIIYENYTDCFVMKDGIIKIHDVDEDYCLSDIMPGCDLQLLEMTPKDRIAQQVLNIPSPYISKTTDNKAWDNLYTYADGDGEFKSYWVVAFQDPELLAADREATKKRMDAMGGDDGDAGVCTCEDGKACSTNNKDNCKDFNNRFAVAAKYKAWLSGTLGSHLNK